MLKFECLMHFEQWRLLSMSLIRKILVMTICVLTICHTAHGRDWDKLRDGIRQLRADLARQDVYTFVINF